MAFFIGTDVGGTFTDLWASASDGQTRVFKTPTTTDVLTGVIDAMNLAAESYALSFERFCSEVERFGHGTTIGLNALLTGNAAKTVILTTSGFADTLEIGRLRRQTSGMNEIEFTDSYLRNRFPPLVARKNIVEVNERVDVCGNVITPLDEDGARFILRGLKKQGVEAIAVCTLWATQNSVHEKRLRELANEEIPGVFVSLSHEISPAVGEYARMSTTAANASLGPLAGRYLSRLEEILRGAGMKVPVLMMTSSGGVLPTDVLNDRPVVALFSGPAGGVIGSRAIGVQMGAKNVLTIDIGGTSFDVGVIVDSRPIMRSEITLPGAEIRIHSIDVSSIGAGGGSIATVQFGELRVGPKSAGANPGPACYGRGGTNATSTDADLLLGVLDAEHFLGGRMKLDVEAARKAIHDNVAKPLGVGVTEAAWAIREVLDNKMADLLRRVTIERGYDPRDFTLFANGGAGPSHAWVLSEELGLEGFVVPAAATAQSAFGTANSDITFTSGFPVYVRVQPGGMPSDQQLARVTTAIQVAVSDVSGNLERANSRGAVHVERLISIRFRGQTHHLDIPLLLDKFDQTSFRETTRRFEEQYENLFGRGAAFSNAGYEILSVRATGYSAMPPPPLSTKGDPIRLVKKRNVIFRDRKNPVETTIYETSFPETAASIVGPAIIEFPGQSVVIPPKSSATADGLGNLHVRRMA